MLRLMLGVALILGLVAFTLGAAFTFAARAVGRRMLLMDTPGSPGHVKPTIRRVPNIGGVAIVAAIVLPKAAGLAGAWWGEAAVRAWAPAALEHLPGIRAQTPLALAVVGAILALHVLGLIDDRRALGPLVKLGVIAGVSAGLVAGFPDLRLLTLLAGHAGGAWLPILATIAWFVLITNAMNFMDNMDGLAASVGAVAAGLLLVTAVGHGQWFVASMLALLAGALAGFLVLNFPRAGGATIFMGDGGSLVVGFLLAFLTVRTTYIPVGEGPAVGGWYSVLLPVAVLAVPLYDLLSVTAIRIAQGKSPLVGDQQHFSHRLRARGLSVRRTLFIVVGCTAATGIAGMTLPYAPGWLAGLVGAQVLLILGMLAVYEQGSTRVRNGDIP
ncbi:MAG: undecaprenyl/decaprenyl-phosphate alpha-N-acetylglucosaminyl 1-phosphate transferase [Phycisphaerales bacterium]|nr:undecaprenyl/decaprenyl-phosphate alpha-N-acetylglucosaminyl 1-phosphate transferase [Phycisphaerales bacterium]